MKKNFLSGLISLSLLSGCQFSNTQNDPFEHYNRALYDVHQVIAQEIYLPIYGAYQYILPLEIRTGINNITNNLLEVPNIIFDLLQGDIEFALSDASRFVINTTFGVFGIFDFASNLYLPKHQQSFSKTLAVWGSDPGPFIVIPGIGAGFLSDHINTVTQFKTMTKLSINHNALSPSLYLNQKLGESGDQTLLILKASDPYTVSRNMALQKFNNYKNAPSYQSLQQDLIDEEMMQKDS
ncbi:MAG: VacJ family lipoprotein [Gammaproteobacteria bacterium]|jgi:phospholipid-binding lipoprotein MlaA|nr:VacJ family lipoprotein [Gammaproteobacteria bacterium]